MPANLDGIIFDQVYGDNTGGAEFDTDNDGTASQEDEFVSFTNTSGGPVDISGWEIWSDSAGYGAPDAAQDGLFHVFEPGTVLQAGDSIFVINEITDNSRDWSQEASEGGVESGAGGISTNFLTEGDTQAESIALVNPATGDFLVFNMDDNPEQVQNLPGFPGTTNIGTIDGHAVASDQNAGSSYQYDAGSGGYVYAAVHVPCFVSKTLIDTDQGPKPVEHLRAGDRVLTLDNGFQPVRLCLLRSLDFSDDVNLTIQRPIEFKPGSMGPDLPHHPLRVSPNHRMLWAMPSGQERLIPAKAFLDRPKVRLCKSVRKVTYHHLVFDSHHIIKAHGIWSESYRVGAWSARRMTPRTHLRLVKNVPNLMQRPPARPLLGVSQAKLVL